MPSISRSQVFQPGKIPPRFLLSPGNAGLMTAVLLCLIIASPSRAVAQGHFADRKAQFTFSGVNFPSVVDTFAVLQVTRFPQPALGVVLRYSTPVDRVARFDLYVYPAPDDQARPEFDRALESMNTVAEQSRQNLQLSSEAITSVTITDSSGRSYIGWRAERTAGEGGASVRSLLYVFVKEESYFKYWLSYSAAADAEMRSRADAFVHATFDRVTVGP